MKLPSSTKPTSGFHICDILELNKDKQQKTQDDKSKLGCDDDEIELKRENLSCESDENLAKNEKRKHSPSPISPSLGSPRKSKKQQKHDDDRSCDASSGHHQLLNETLQQYPHLFQNHPAMRPWFNSSGEFRVSLAEQSGSDEPFCRISRFN